MHASHAMYFAIAHYVTQNLPDQSKFASYTPVILLIPKVSVPLAMHDYTADTN